MERVLRAYSERGHPLARVYPSRFRRNEDGRLGFVLRIGEGPEAEIEAVRVFGNSHTLEVSVDPKFTPKCSVVIAAYNESDHIEQTIRGALAINYPDYEVVIIDDGSTDDTAAKVLPFVRTGQVRLVRKMVNEGKAMALNDGLCCTNGEVLLVMDADAIPDPNILSVVVPHFKYPRVGAVTGNPPGKVVRPPLETSMPYSGPPDWDNSPKASVRSSK